MTGCFPEPPGLAVFLNAGDPPLDVLADVVKMLDERGVDCLELAVPFPNSVTDGAVIRRSAQRALATDVELDQVLAFVDGIRDELRRLRIVLFADWGHTVRPWNLADYVAAVAASGADGGLVHGLPPRLRPEYYELAAAAGLPVVTTCYSGSSPGVLSEAAQHATAYVYLVSHYGRTGSAGLDEAALRSPIAVLRAKTRAPIAVGFGVRTRADVKRVHELGADAAIVGSAVVACVESSLSGSGDVVADLADFVADLHPTQNPREETVRR